MNTTIEFNEITKRLPKHLHQFIVKQPYDSYTAQNQAVWRYVMRMNIDYLGKVAHESYLLGLESAGISSESIPMMEGMNRILKRIGWAAVSVDGFIPPNAFMEFQGYNVLVIASDIRTLEHLEYTPAPDIIHEAAGHAPIIANPEYAEYLRRFGEIGSKAISSAKDYDMYEAIRKLSILKEDPTALEATVSQAQTAVEYLQENMGELSEMAQIRNLHWWTVEYGLIGTLEAPQIYGAGLLSSIGESARCLKEEVKKLPYDISAAKKNFDITKPQPQLYVTPDFAHLSFVLEEFANNMALRKGGLSGLNKLVNSGNLGSIELSTGIQISGVFTHVISHDSKPVYIQTTGPTALASRDKELIGHGVKGHKDGFGSPVGKLKGINLAIEDMSPRDLDVYGIKEGENSCLEFEGGVKVKGDVITGKRDLQGKILLISFKNCKVTYNETVLFDPSWGTYDMAVGKSVIAAFSGPASPSSFDEVQQVSEIKTPKINYSEKDKNLYKLYAKVREIREEKLSVSPLEQVFDVLKTEFSSDWLLALEIYELVSKEESEFSKEVLGYLKNKPRDMKSEKLILSGLRLISKC